MKWYWWILRPVFLVSLLFVLALMISACAAEETAVVIQPEAEEAELTEAEVITDAEDITTTEAITPSDSAVEAGTPSDGVVGAPETLVSASLLLDYEFENQDGEVTGEIEDLLVDLLEGRVLFTTIEYGGFLDLGDTELPVPLNAFTIGPEGELVLNFDEQALENFPDVGDDWPNLLDATWDDEIVAFWDEIGIDPAVDVTEASPAILQYSGMIGIPMIDVGLGEGAVEDLIINLGTGRVRYVVLISDATVTAGAGFTEAILMPVSALDFSNLTDGLAVDPDLDLATLQEAPRIDPALYRGAEFLAPELDAELQEFWTAQGFPVEPE